MIDTSNLEAALKGFQRGATQFKIYADAVDQVREVLNVVAQLNAFEQERDELRGEIAELLDAKYAAQHDMNVAVEKAKESKELELAALAEKSAATMVNIQDEIVALQTERDEIAKILEDQRAAHRRDVERMAKELKEKRDQLNEVNVQITKLKAI